MLHIKRFLGFTFLMAGWITLIQTFIIGYATSSKTVLINLNNYGEADFEFYILILPSIFFGFFFINEVFKANFLKKE